MRRIVKILFFITLQCACSKNNIITSRARSVSFSGGNGTSIEEAVIIKYAKNILDIEKAKTIFLNKTINTDWKVLDKSYSIESKIEILIVKTTKPESIYNVFFSMEYYLGS